MNCPKCNNKIYFKMKFCTKCGYNVEEYRKQEKEKKKVEIQEKFYKIKKKIAIILFVLFIFLMGSVIGLNMYFSNRNFKNFEKKSEFATKELDIIDDSILGDTEEKFELTENNKNLDYDNDNLTNEEEVTLGTDPYKEDTDKDGIVDGDEVNDYKTDPLKWSTSGDSISDFVKIRKNLDVNKSYANDEIKPENIEVNNDVVIIPSDLDSEQKCTFKEFSFDTRINSYKKIFSVYGLKGKIEYKLDETDVVLLTVWGGKYTEFDDYSIKGNVLTINIEDEDNAVDFVIVTKENYEKYQEGDEK